MVTAQDYYSLIKTFCYMYIRKMCMKILVKINQCLILAIILVSQNNLSKLVIDKMKNDTDDVAINEFFGL